MADVSSTGPGDSPVIDISPDPNGVAKSEEN